MTQNECTCDGCKKPITNPASKVSFVPLRGGLTLVAGNSTTSIDRQFDFCDETCVAEFIKSTRK